MGETKSKLVRAALSVIVILLAIVGVAWLFIQRGAGTITNEYFWIYAIAGIFTFLAGTISFLVDFVFSGSTDSLLGRSLFIFQQDKMRPLSLFWPLSLAVFAGLTLFILFLVVGTGQSIFTPPNPYTQSLVYSTESFSLAGTVENLINGAFIPAIFEEGLIFFGIQGLTWILLLLIYLLSGQDNDLLENPFLFWGVTVLAVGIGAAGFSIAHGRYAGNQEFLAFAFAFEFVVQMANQLTGSFLSWIPHFFHNAAVISKQSFSFVLASVIPFIIPSIKGWVRE